MVSHIDGLVQERRNSSANALQLRLSCTNPVISADQLLVKQLVQANTKALHELSFVEKIQ